MSNLKNVTAQVKSAYDIAEFITMNSGVELRGSGASLKGLCPFHSENTPSFTVNRSFQSYRCFGCGESGDIISFYMKYENLDFIDALTRLAEDKGIEIKKEENEGVSYRQIKDCVKATAFFFIKRFREIDENHPAKKDITDRGLALNSLKYGYAPEAFDALYNHLKKEGFDDDVIIASGVCKKAKNDKIIDMWRGRLMFIIGDISGNPVGFSGRKLFESEKDKSGKYVNSPDTPVFNKSRLLFNASSARKTAGKEKEIYVAEGQFDVVAMKESGITNCVAALGTAFTKEHADMCRKIVENGKIIFCFDGDSAGIEAAMKVFKNIPHIHSQSFVVQLPEGSDPCDYRLENGPESLNAYVRENQVPLADFVLARVKDSRDMSSDMERSSYIADAVKMLSIITDDGLRESCIRKVALASVTTSINGVKKAISDYESKKYSGREEEEEQKEELPRIEITEDENEVIYRIHHSQPYRIAATAIAIAARSDSDDDVLNRLERSSPKTMKNVLREIRSMKNEGLIIPEKSSMSNVVEILIGNELLPHEENLSESDLQNLLEKNTSRLEEAKKRAMIKKIKANTRRLLEESDGGDSQYFEELLKQEREQIDSIII